MEVLPLPVERAVVARPRLDDEIVGFPEALHHPGRPVVPRRHFIGHAAHEPALEPPARVHVDHRHLLGHPHRLAPIGDGIAEDQQPRLPRLAREHAHDDGAARIQVGRRLMVLVHHDLEPHLLGDLPLVDEAVIEIGADLRVVVAVGQLHSDGVVLPGIGQQVIRVLAEEPATHATPSYAPRSRPNNRMSSTTASGCSRWGKCPAPSTSSSRAPGMAAR